MRLEPLHNDIVIDVINRTCVITSNPNRVKKSYIKTIPQKDCVEIMTIMRQAGYTFNIDGAYMTRTFSNFFRN